jgi:2',3'-cyclic-nucleotide 2'-phosphodiesterase (5'-nucleotidase family)
MTKAATRYTQLMKALTAAEAEAEARLEQLKVLQESVVAQIEADRQAFNILVANSLGGYQTPDTDPETGATIYYFHDQPQLANSSKVWKMTADTFSATDNYQGAQTDWKMGMDVSGNALLHNLSADWINAGTKSADRIGAGSITATKIASNAVTADKINAGAITAGKIAANAVTAEKLSADAITGKTITGGLIKGTTLTGAKLSTSSDSGGTYDTYAHVEKGRVYFGDNSDTYDSTHRCMVTIQGGMYTYGSPSQGTDFEYPTMNIGSGQYGTGYVVWDGDYLVGFWGTETDRRRTVSSKAKIKLLNGSSYTEKEVYIMGGLIMM